MILMAVRHRVQIDPDQLPGTVICYTDSTIALPLLTAYALARHAPRPLKRLYDRRAGMMEAFRRAYFTEGRGAQARAKG